VSVVEDWIAVVLFITVITALSTSAYNSERGIFERKRETKGIMVGKMG